MKIGLFSVNITQSNFSIKMLNKQSKLQQNWLTQNVKCKKINKKMVKIDLCYFSIKLTYVWAISTFKPMF